MNLVLANAGVPMLFLHIPTILVALLPIIAIEAFVAQRLLGRPIRKSLWPITAANVVSMLLGFPLLWLFGVLGQMLVGGGSAYGLGSWWLKLYAVTVQAPWLIPYESDLFWMIPAAGLAMLIPAFSLSVWLERVVLQWFWKEEQKNVLRRFSFRAHCASYLVLVLLWLAYGMHSFSEQKKQNRPPRTTQAGAPLS